MVSVQLAEQVLKIEGDIFHLLHTGALYDWVTINDIEYIQFSFQSVQEARYRMMALALLTYSFKRSAFIWLFGLEVWAFSGARLQEYLESVEAVYGVRVKRAERRARQARAMSMFFFSNRNAQFLELAEEKRLEVKRMEAKFYAKIKVSARGGDGCLVEAHEDRRDGVRGAVSVDVRIR